MTFAAGRLPAPVVLALAAVCACACGVGATAAAAAAPTAPGRDAGILYEVWHASAAHLMHRVKAAGATQPVTVETVIRSNGRATLDEVFSGPTPEVPAGFTPDIYNVQPKLGFYCLCVRASDPWQR